MKDKKFQEGKEVEPIPLPLPLVDNTDEIRKLVESQFEDYRHTYFENIRMTTGYNYGKEYEITKNLNFDIFRKEGMTFDQMRVLISEAITAILNDVLEYKYVKDEKGFFQKSVQKSGIVISSSKIQEEWSNTSKQSIISKYASYFINEKTKPMNDWKILPRVFASTFFRTEKTLRSGQSFKEAGMTIAQFKEYLFNE